MSARSYLLLEEIQLQNDDKTEAAQAFVAGHGDSASSGGSSGRGGSSSGQGGGSSSGTGGFPNHDPGANRGSKGRNKRRGRGSTGGKPAAAAVAPRLSSVPRVPGLPTTIPGPGLSRLGKCPSVHQQLVSWALVRRPIKQWWPIILSLRRCTLPQPAPGTTTPCTLPCNLPASPPLHRARLSGSLTQEQRPTCPTMLVYYPLPPRPLSFFHHGGQWCQVTSHPYSCCNYPNCIFFFASE
jgi:hypothetical protein